jgi:6-pyruvoyltetrahydropterin/6-carboxytetrahydropterin synthase
MFTISKTFDLSYSHQLDSLPEGHQCKRLHGHNAVVCVELAGHHVNKHGFIMDYGDLAPLKAWLDETFDHRHINDIVTFQPTAERLAAHVYDWCQRRAWPVVRVGWSETPKTWAWYSE